MRKLICGVAPYAMSYGIELVNTYTYCCKKSAEKPPVIKPTILQSDTFEFEHCTIPDLHSTTEAYSATRRLRKMKHRTRNSARVD